MSSYDAMGWSEIRDYDILFVYVVVVVLCMAYLSCKNQLDSLCRWVMKIVHIQVKSYRMEIRFSNHNGLLLGSKFFPLREVPFMKKDANDDIIFALFSSLPLLWVIMPGFWLHTNCIYVWTVGLCIPILYINKVRSNCLKWIFVAAALLTWR